MWAWGDNTDGQLGNGNFGLGAAYNPAPSSVHVVTDVVAAASGETHSLALTSDQTAWAWGDNANGELGFPGPSVVTPTQVTALSNVQAIAAGRGYDGYGGFSMALDTSGTVWAWGDNVDGELGNGHSGDTNSTPQAIPGLGGVKAIAAGNLFGLVLLSDGNVQAWGFNGDGELGIGTSSTGGCSCITSPVRVQFPTGVSIAAIAAGNGFALAVDSNGMVWAWGDNLLGQLGVNTATICPDGDPCAQTPVQLTNPSHVSSVAAGAEFGLALDANGTVWSWGDNSSGELGTGDASITRTIPMPVYTLTGVKSIAAGDFHALALEPDGTVWSWGDNSFGQLGVTTVRSSNSPVNVRSLNNVVAIGSGGNDSFGIVGSTTIVPTFTPGPTYTPTAVSTATTTPIPTNTPLPPTTTTTPVAPTATHTPANTPTATHTPAPPTATNTPTNAPTATTIPTNTPLPPSATTTPIPAATTTPVPTATNTPIPPPPPPAPSNTPAPVTAPAPSAPTDTPVPFVPITPPQHAGPPPSSGVGLGGGAGSAHTPTPTAVAVRISGVCPPRPAPPSLRLRLATARVTDGSTATLTISTNPRVHITGYFKNGGELIARVEGTADGRGHLTAQELVSIHPSRPTQALFIINAFNGCGVTSRTARLTVMPAGRNPSRPLSHQSHPSHSAPRKGHAVRPSHATHTADTSLTFGVGVTPGAVSNGSNVTLTLHAPARTHVLVLARVLPYSAVQGKAQPGSGAVLYQKLLRGTTDAHGQYTGRVQLSYKQTKGAVLLVSMREGDGSNARTARVTLLPTRHHPGRTLMVSVKLKPGTATSADSLSVAVQSVPHVSVAALVRALSTKTVTSGKGKSAKKQLQVSILYQKVLKGTTNSHGQYSGDTTLTYKPATSKPSIFTIAVL